MNKSLLLLCVLFDFFYLICGIHEQILFDFETNNDLSSWNEQSDTVRELGKSKATLVIQKTKVFQRAILFTLLNPQPNGAAFAGVRTTTDFNLRSYNSLNLRIRGQGENSGYKIVLRHKGNNDDPYPEYCQLFTAPFDYFSAVNLSLANFEPYYHGRPVNNTELLNLSNITNFGLQIYGGVYLPNKQSGVSSLEIEWISVSSK